MVDQTIKTKREIYSCVNITLLIPMKTTIPAWVKKLGMKKKAGLLRLDLATGFLELSKGITPDEINLLLTDAEKDPSSSGEATREGVLPTS